MPIPFPPDGPQVQAALQKVPTSQLQNYAAGRPPQPTGQVTPGPMGAAAEALNARGAMGAANQRQQAMQNNPANSPTIFQQKDMELQQKAQQLAAMGQQIQQKEQQLGVLGVLMAKKAKELQAREMGVAALPMRPDMFTAMDGGIVFAGGGDVEGYASRGMVGQFTPVPKRARILEAAGLDIDEEEKKDPLDETIAKMRSGVLSLEDAARTARLSPEEKKRRLEEAAAGDKALYEKYKTGVAGLDEETAAAIRGRPANTMQGIAAGLAALPADLRGIRLAGLMTRLAGGVAGERAKAEERENKAAMYTAEAKRKQALADFEEERGRTKRANELVASAEADLEKAYRLDKDVIAAEVGAEKEIAGLRQKEELNAAKLAAAEKLQAERLKSADAINQIRMAAYEKRTELMHQVQLAKIEAAKAGEGKTDLQVSARIIEAKLREANARLPKDKQLSDALIKDQALKDARDLLYSSRDMSARASMLRAITANEDSEQKAIAKLVVQGPYLMASPEEQEQMKEEIRKKYRTAASGTKPSGAMSSNTVLKFDVQGNPIK